MSSQNPEPLDYSNRPSALASVGRFIGGFVFGFGAMFAATFVAGAASFEQQPVRWAIPLVIAVAIPVAIVAWIFRRRSPVTSAGIWTGWILGLLLAGACFTGT